MSRVSLRSTIATAAGSLEKAGVPSPGVDAEELAAHLLGVSRTRLGMTPLVEATWVEQYHDLVAKRAQRIPLQHLLGSRAVRPGPAGRRPGCVHSRGRRPSRWSPGRWMPSPRSTKPVVIDLCTGSGAIALAISAARPDARVIGVERSPAALAWARRNVVAHIDAGGSRVELRGGDIADQRLLADLDGTADLVTANPPYVPDGTAVEPEVARVRPGRGGFRRARRAGRHQAADLDRGRAAQGRGSAGHRARRHPGRDRARAAAAAGGC